MNNYNRRTFINQLTQLIGVPIAFGACIPDGLSLLIEENDSLMHNIIGKHPELVVLNDRPLNAETPAHLLGDVSTPADKMFVRNNGLPPVNPSDKNWTLTIGGNSINKELAFTIDELKSSFEHHTYQLTLECGGNGRSEFDPPAKGNQWTTGAVACPTWTGVRLKDVLQTAGVKSNAVYLGYYGADTHLSGDENKVVISRGVPLKKAMENESLIAWNMNGQPLPVLHGYPLRLVFGGWPASCSGKWLQKLIVIDKVHDGPKMGGQSYRVPCNPVAPGAKVDDEDMCIIESMPVKSIITSPKTGALTSKSSVTIAGHAWAGDLAVAKIESSIDFGQTWQQCQLEKPINRLAWQQWSSKVTFPEKGYYEIWVKATDEKGRAQPMLLPGWNPKGYLNNACHRIAIKYTG